jgi:uncharacterized protein (TIGR00369 family)
MQDITGGPKPSPEAMPDPATDSLAPEIAARVHAIFDGMAAMRLIGARLGALAPGMVTIELPIRPELTQQNGYVHAGITAMIGDTAGGLAGATLFPPTSDVLAVEFKINLLAPARGAALRAVGRVLKPGRTLTVCEVEVLAAAADGQATLCAKLQQTLIRIDPR